MIYRVEFATAADNQLNEIEDFISREATPSIAAQSVDAIVARCESLAHFPRRGTSREDLRRGLRTLPFRRRVTITYLVEETRVVVVGIFYAGRDFAELRSD